MKTAGMAAVLLSLSLLTGCSSTVETAAVQTDSKTVDASSIVMDLAVSQHTVREFADQKISDDDLQKLLEVAFCGATSGGQQAREVIVVNDRTVMKEIQAVHIYAQSLDTAPVVLVIAGNEENAVYAGNLSQDTSIAAQNVVLLASSLSIASNIMSIYPSQDRIAGISSALDLPDTVVPYIMVALGYAKEDTASSASSNSTEYASMVHYNSWDN